MYEQKMAELHKRYKKLRIRVWLLWIPYTIVTNVIAWFIFNYFNFIYFFIIFAAVNLFASLFVSIQQTNHWRAEEETQRNLLMDDAPMGRFKI